MSDYADREYPKWKYHRKLGGKIVHNADEERALGDSWYDNPKDSANTSQFVTFLQRRIKPQWGRWAWIVAGISAILALIGGMTKLWR
jgi:hypothetical protein